MLGALVNLAKQITNRTVFIDSSGVQYLLPSLKSQVTAYYIKSLFCLAYLIEEDNNETIMANAGKNYSCCDICFRVSGSADKFYF